MKPIFINALVAALVGLACYQPPKPVEVQPETVGPAPLSEEAFAQLQALLRENKGLRTQVEDLQSKLADCESANAKVRDELTAIKAAPVIPQITPQQAERQEPPPKTYMVVRRYSSSCASGSCGSSAGRRGLFGRRRR
jgi:hypothetical protein